jgi:hypothetical protein
MRSPSTNLKRRPYSKGFDAAVYHMQKAIESGELDEGKGN